MRVSVTTPDFRAFLFTDLEGSSLLWLDHRAAMQAAVAAHDEVLRAAAARHGGEVFKTAGDAFFICFRRPSDAVLAACEAQAALAAQNWPPIGSLKMRAAIHAGTAEQRDGDYFGPALNRCARLLSICNGGQVLVTAAVAELLASEREVSAQARPLGSYPLDDPKQAVGVFQIVVEGLRRDFPPLHAKSPPGRVSRRWAVASGVAALSALAGGVWWVGWGARHPPSPRSIAVLPFANLSGDPAQDYLSEGLSEEVINDLARLNGLQVIARTSSFPFRGGKLGSREIGERLGVAYILDGSVRAAEGLVRIGAQLVKAATGFEVWSETFDRQLKDILAIETEIARAVAEALAVKLLNADIANFSLGGAANEQAYDDYLRGRHLFESGGIEAVYRSALAAFDAAIAADEMFAAAHSSRAQTLLVIADVFTPLAQQRATFDEALASARRAVALAPDLAEGQATLGSVLQLAEFDLVGARQAFARAMATGAGSADVLMRYGQFACDIGDFSAGLPAQRRATVLDPLNPRVFRSLGYSLIKARRFTEGIAAMKRALQLNAAVEGAHAAIGDALLLQGDFAGAKREYAFEPVGWVRETGLAIVAHRQGDRAAAARAFKALTAGVQPTIYQQAEVLAQWGEPDKAIEKLEQAFAHGDPAVTTMKSDPMLDPLRKYPFYQQLQRRLGL
jgi:TolB-like protein/class 3 adenylate cyclase